MTAPDGEPSERDASEHDAFEHDPVMVREIVDALAPVPAGVVVDATLGAGGHSEALLDSRDDLAVLGLDRDPDALAAAAQRLERFGSRLMTHRCRFDELPDAMAAHAVEGLSGALFDLGVSSPQLDRPERGFSYRHEGPLDMRMNQSRGTTAAELLASITREDLVNLLRLYGEEIHAGPIAAAIVRSRREKPITGTLQLAEIVASAVPAHQRRDGNPARKTFQALRIAVNHEQEELAHLLAEIPEVMADGGRAVLISFHSLEDRMVKQAMRTWQSPCQCPRDFPQCVCGKTPLGRSLTPKPVTPSMGELEGNPRSRSAKLRAFEFRKGVSHELLR